MFSGKYDKDCADKLRAVWEWTESILGLAFLVAGVVGVWFIGCAGI